MKTRLLIEVFLIDATFMAWVFGMSSTPSTLSFQKKSKQIKRIHQEAELREGGLDMAKCPLRWRRDIVSGLCSPASSPCTPIPAAAADADVQDGPVRAACARGSLQPANF